MALIKKNQEKLLIAHERSKTITRSAEMKEIRERMQVLDLAVHSGCACSECTVAMHYEHAKL